MANAYSIVRQYGDYIPPYDFNLIGAGLQYKQQKFDANAAKLQAQLDEYASLDLAKIEDKEYFYGRINNMVEQLNGFSNMDLSSDALTRNIGDIVSSSIDDKVMTAYLGTKRLRTLQAEIADIKENQRELYNPRNESFALKTAQDWLTDGEAGSSYAGGSYTPYTDYTAKLDKTIGDIRKNKSEQVFEVPQLGLDGQPTGYMVKKTVKEMTDVEVRNIAYNSLDENDRNQIQIDGWYNYSQLSDDDAVKDLKRTHSSKRTILDGMLAVLKTKDTDKMTKQERENHQNTVGMLEDELSSLGDMEKILISRGKSAIGAYLTRESLLDGMVMKHRFREESEEWSKDDTFWTNQELQYKRFNDARNYGLNRLRTEGDLAIRRGQLQVSQARLGLDREKWSVEAQERLAKLGMNPDGTPKQTSPDYTVTNALTADPNKRKISTERGVYDNITALKTSAVSKINDAVQGLDDDTRKAFNKVKAKAKEESPGIDDERATIQAFQQLKKKFKPEDIVTIVNDLDDYRGLVTNHQELLDRNAVTDKDLRRIVEKLAKEDTAFIAPNGEEVTAEDYFTEYADLQTLAADGYKQKFQETVKEIQKFGIWGADSRFKNFIPKLNFYIQKYAEATGQREFKDLKSEDVFRVRMGLLEVSPSLPNDVKGFATDLREGLQKTASAQSKYRDWGRTSSLVGKGKPKFDNTVYDVFDYDNMVGQVEEELNDLVESLPRNIAYTFDPGTAEHDNFLKLAAATRNADKGMPGLAYDKLQNMPVTVSQDDDGNLVIVSNITRTSSSGVYSTPSITNVPKEFWQANPQINNLIRQTEEDYRLKNAIDLPKTYTVSSYLNDANDVYRLDLLNNTTIFPESELNKVTINGVHDMLSATIRGYAPKDGKTKTEFRRLAESVMDNAKDFTVHTETKNDNFYVTVKAERSGELFSRKFRFSPDKRKVIKDRLETEAQYMVTMALADVLAKEAVSAGTPNYRILKEMYLPE